MPVKIAFLQEHWEERRLKAGPVRCVSFCATGSKNLKGYRGILRCVPAKDMNPLFFPHSFRQARDLEGVDLEVLMTIIVQVAGR